MLNGDEPDPDIFSIEKTKKKKKIWAYAYRLKR